MNSLKQKAIHGASWSMLDNLASSGITFLVGLVLARLLSPAEFGILGMIAVFVAISNAIVDSGLSNALVRKIDVKDVDYNTVFYFNLFLGLILYAILFFSAEAISIFFHEPLLVPVTRTMGIVLIINAFTIVQRTILIKNVDFKTQTKISFIASIVSGVLGIGMAFRGFGVWSLVWQQIVRQLFNTIFLWIYSTWRPALEFSKNSFNELFKFGYKLLLSGLIDSIYNNIYYLIIGKFYTVSQLGQYTRAEQFNSIFANNLTSVVQRVSFPVLSGIQNEVERLQQIYKHVIKFTMLISFASLMGLAAISKPLILILIGEKWLPAAVFLQIICFAGMLYPLHAINLNMLKVKGRSDLFLKLEVLKKIIAIIPICLGIFYGIEYMLWGSVLTSFAAFFLNSYYSGKLVNYSSWAQLKDILPTFTVSSIVAAAMWSITFINFSISITLLIQCVLGFTMAFVIYEFLKLPEYLELKKIALSVINRK